MRHDVKLLVGQMKRGRSVLWTKQKKDHLVCHQCLCLTADLMKTKGTHWVTEAVVKPQSLSSLQLHVIYVGHWIPRHQVTEDSSAFDAASSF